MNLQKLQSMKVPTVRVRAGKTVLEEGKPGGCVYVLDLMTDPTHTQPKFSALFAVNMALTTQNGWVFSDEEVQSWLTEAGFRDFSCRPLPPPMPHWLATARKESDR